MAIPATATNFAMLLSLFLGCLVIPLTLLTCLFSLLRIHTNYKNFPPGPPTLPIIGNLHQLGKFPHHTLWELSRKYGPVIGIKLGAVPAVVISSPEAAKEVLKVHDLKCCSRPSRRGPSRLSYKSLDIAFAPYSNHWREMRKFCVLELLSVKRVQSFRSIREKEVNTLVDSISKHAYNSKNTPVDLSEMLFSLVATAICKIAFGVNFRGNKISVGGLNHLMHEVTASLQDFSAADSFPRGGWLVDKFTGFHGRLEKTFHKLDEFFQEIIDQHMNNDRVGDEVQDMTDFLLQMTKDDQTQFGVPITHSHIKAIYFDLFVAGVDTSSTTMIWAMAELVRNPSIMRKVQREITEHVKGRDSVTENDIEHLQYLKLIVKETLRLHPPVPLLVARETLSTVKINGYDIPKKAYVFVNVWGMGRDPKIWEFAEKFEPERFQDNPIDYKGHHFEYLPFGSGRRTCPGMHMGMAMVELALANLLYAFDWILPDDDNGVMKAYGADSNENQALMLLPRHRKKEET